MLFVTRMLLIGLLGVGITAATAAQAGNQLFSAEWYTKSFGNELTNGTGVSAVYSAWAMPQGILCNPDNPRCPFVSTPTDGSGNFAPLGGVQATGPFFCAPWSNFQGMGTTARPAKGETALDGKGRPIPPLYRNPAFFTPGGGRDTVSCTATSTGYTPDGKGRVQAGNPVPGTWTAYTTGGQNGGFSIPAAPKNHKAGIRTTGQIGSFTNIYPYVYSYTYATLRNDAGVFGPGQGPGAFNVLYKQGANTVASINVKAGGAKFGGTMRMLGALTTKVCYYRNGGCSLGRNNWRYDAVGATAYTAGGVVISGYVATYKAYYYHTALGQTSTVNVEGSRFPWTTGSVTLTAKGRGPHKTVHYTQGYDNRNTATASGKGTIQLVTPVITRWLQPAVNFETGGVGILRINFLPEPATWAMLIAGASLLGVGYRMRGR